MIDGVEQSRQRIGLSMHRRVCLQFIRHCAKPIFLIALAATICLAGCASTQSPRVAPESIYDIRAGRYDSARRNIRRHAVDEQSPDVILDNLRLAVASIHDGAMFESRFALSRAYPYMVSGTVNQNGNAHKSPFWEAEGRLVWKGEPFEQAGAWYYQSLNAMLNNDWENARAAAQNMLFTLVDFAGAETIGEAMQLAESPEWFDEHSAEVESDLVIGYVLLGVSESLQNNSYAANEAFAHALRLQPQLKDLILQLQERNYNTLWFVEAERGPRKVLLGRHGETFIYRPVAKHDPGTLEMITSVAQSSGDLQLSARLDVVDFWKLSRHPRWWSMRSLREGRAVLGDVLKVAGAGAAVYGGANTDSTSGRIALIAGVSMIIFGESLTQSAEADKRFLDVLPRTVYLVPLQLPPGEHTIQFNLDTGDQQLSATRHLISPGQMEGATPSPSVYTARLMRQRHASAAPTIASLAPNDIRHCNDATGHIAGRKPYILGGTCVCTPTPSLMQAYSAAGVLGDWTVGQLDELYRAEGIVRAPLPAVDRATSKTYHHILRKGRLLYTPRVGSAGFEQLTFQSAPPYVARSTQLIALRSQ